MSNLENIEKKSEHVSANNENFESKLKEMFLEKYPDRIYKEPNDAGHTSVKFNSPLYMGDELDSHHSLLFEIPEEYKGRLVRDVILTHRKDPSRWDGVGHDPCGSYSRVEVLSSDGRVNTWSDPAGYSPDKFAERRGPQDPEVEVLHDWLLTVGRIDARYVFVTNVGVGDLSTVNFHSLEIVFFPNVEKTVCEEKVFSPGTTFIDVGAGVLEPTYGYQKNEGIYPGALAIGSYTNGFNYERDSDEDYFIDSIGKLHIKLKEGRKFIGMELSVGDTHPDGVNKKGHIGTRGWAKIYAQINSENSEIDLMQNVNVPPAGVLFGGPKKDSYDVRKKDEVVITSSNDICYLMGYRMIYEDTED